MRRPLYIRLLGLLSYAFFHLHLYADDPGGGGATAGPGPGAGSAGGDPVAKTGAGAGQGGQPGAAAVDVQAQIRQALEAQAATFNEQFKAATGHESLGAFQEAEARRKGEEGRLLDKYKADNAALLQRIEQAQISNALLGAAKDAVNPAEIAQLLGGKAKLAADGAVTLDGKPVDAAVADYLKLNPHHAKSSGGTGSGAGQQAGVGEANPWARETFNLTRQGQILRSDPAKAAQMQAAAGVQ